MSSTMQGKRSKPGLLTMAKEILALSIPEKDLVGAEKMVSCNLVESCKSFERFSNSIWELQLQGYDLEEVVQCVAGKRNAWLSWGPEEMYTRDELMDQAMEIQKVDVPGSDLRLATRILSKKVGGDEWKHALQTSSIWAQEYGEEEFLAEYLTKGHDKEITELKKHISLVLVEDDTFRFPG